MSLVTFTISGNDYKAYATLDEANIVLIADPVRSATWAMLTDERRMIMLVAATRRLDLLAWRGNRTGGSAQDTAWPRTGLKYEDGTDIPDDAIPQALVTAVSLLAGTIAQNSSHSNFAQPIAPSTGRRVRSLRAGPVEVEFQAGATASPVPGQAGTPVLSDPTALEYIRQWLTGTRQSQPPAILGGFTSGHNAFDYQSGNF